jgi:hypothetical protein
MVANVKDMGPLILKLPGRTEETLETHPEPLH